MVMVVVMMIVMMMVVVVMMMVMIVMMIVMMIFSNYHRIFFRDGGIGAFVLGAQNIFCIRNGIQQLGK